MFATSLIVSVGLRIDDSCLGELLWVCTLATPSVLHTFANSGAKMSAQGLHVLHKRHSALNDIIHHALTAAGITSRFESPGLLQSDS